MRKAVILVLAAAIAASCAPSGFEQSAEWPAIFPDYTAVTVPEGTPRLNFRMADGRKCKVSRKDCGDSIMVSVKAWEKGSRKGIRYKDFPIYISKDPIDPFIAYRLIEPGYESWSGMGLYQRDLRSYREYTIVENSSAANGCVNCHTFQGGNPERMLFHARGKGGGTVFIDGDSVKLTNLADVGIKRQGTYPAWHPDGRYVVFSSNTTKQCFTYADPQPIEVYDTVSDIILFDTLTGESSTYPPLCTEETLETFPAWSPDGTTLYYCASANTPDNGKQRGDVRYRLMSIAFSDGAFTGEPQTVWECDSISVSFPRVNGDKILFTASAYGTFPIWHKEADLWLLDPVTGEVSPAAQLNSADTESYHSWSSNGRWVVFSSRRTDGRYTRLYISHWDGANFTKPFLLPQKDPAHNDLRLKSYNIPEFVKGRVPDRNKAVSKLFSR